MGARNIELGEYHQKYTLYPMFLLVLKKYSREYIFNNGDAAKTRKDGG
jgi:hypothetical protein